MRRNWIVLGSLVGLLWSAAAYGQIVQARIGMEGIT